MHQWYTLNLPSHSLVLLTQFDKVTTSKQKHAFLLDAESAQSESLIKHECEASTKPYCQEVVWQAGAAGAIAAGHDCWGSLLFCLSLNHKQMSMYYAPAFFAHLLGKCLQRPTALRKVQELHAMTYESS